MTIAAGMLTPEGVELAYDSQFQFGSQKSTMEKLVSVGELHAVGAGSGPVFALAKDVLTEMNNPEIGTWERGDLISLIHQCAEETYNWCFIQTDEDAPARSLELLVTDGHTLWQVFADQNVFVAEMRRPVFIGSGSSYAIGAGAAIDVLAPDFVSSKQFVSTLVAVACDNCMGCGRPVKHKFVPRASKPILRS